MNYYELRQQVSGIIPRQHVLSSTGRLLKSATKEKGRKHGYHQFNLREEEWIKSERLLNTEEFPGFIEVSLRAAACPMPLNGDVYDSMACVVEGQKIKTVSGWIEIQDIKTGDWVYAYEEKTKTVVLEQVTSTFQSMKSDIVEIETEEGLLKVTSDHPVYTRRGWITARNLDCNDEILQIEAERFL